MSYGIPNRGEHPWTLDEASSRPFIQRAIELGINFFDTSNSYSDGTSEEITGRALRDFAKRDEIVLATKAFYPWRKGPNTGGLSRKALFAAVDASLQRLGMDYIDLYQIHRWDDDTPIEETLEALHDIVKWTMFIVEGQDLRPGFEVFQRHSLREGNTIRLVVHPGGILSRPEEIAA